MQLNVFAAGVCLAILAGCAQFTAPPSSQDAGSESLREARSKSHSIQERAALYLEAAAKSAHATGQGKMSAAARATYNDAAGELAVLLRSANDGQLWGRPFTLKTASGAYRLSYQAAGKSGVWAPDFFTSLVLASDVPEKIIKRRDLQEGIGGALVGVRKKTPSEPFAPRVGITAPVTATLDFHGREAVLTLRDPSAQPKAIVAGVMQPLAADFSAPLAYYPNVNETIAGLMGALRVSDYMNQTGIYMMQPYDPHRIPLIFVHGLISTARMWRNVVNEIEMDPTLRGRFQCWVFNYPTGNPVVYSAMRFRQDLAKVEQVYPGHLPFVLVGHSLGGIVSRMQATTLDRAAWVQGRGKQAGEALDHLPSDGLVHRALIFNANPRIRRIVFICTPHRGSAMAVGGIGDIAMRLIALPSSLASQITGQVGNELSAFTGRTSGLPNSIFSLSPENPTLKVMDKLPIRAPYHTIFGDRGIHNEPNSTDGIVAYWSSHLNSAVSEKSVPGPHGACELPQTIEELQRILHLHLKTSFP